MSAKNKPWNKKARRQKRFNTDGSSHPRSDAAGTPVLRQIATKILTNPKYKVNARTRRKLALRRGVVVEVPRTQPTHPSVKLALKLTKLPLAMLFRRLKQSARRAATCKNILAELSKDSQFAPPIEAQHTHQLGVYKQVAAEIKSRQ